VSLSAGSLLSMGLGQAYLLGVLVSPLENANYNMYFVPILEPSGAMTLNSWVLCPFFFFFLNSFLRKGVCNLLVFFCFFFFKIYLFIICKYTVAVFKHSRRGSQILLRMVVSHHVVAGI
jgi:hypothetical protein